MRKTLIACACVLFGAAVPAVAQVNSLVTDNPRETARVKFGPLYVTPFVVLNEMGFDTNVFNKNGEPQSDFMVSVIPQARVWMPFGRRALLKTDFASDLVWYREFSSERSIDPQLTSNAEIYFRRFTLLGNASYVYSRQRPSFELDLRARREERSFGGGVDVKVAPKVTVGFSMGRKAVEFDGDAIFEGTLVQTTLNREGTTASGNVQYRWTPLTSFSLTADRTADQFEFDPRRDNSSTRVMAGVAFEPRALVNGSARVGFRRLEADNDEAFDEFTGMVADVALEYTMMGSTTFRLTHGRDVVYSFDPLHPYYVDNNFGAGVRRAIGPRFDVIAGADRHQYGYRNLLAVTGDDGIEPGVPVPRRAETTWSINGSVGYRVGRDARIGLGGTYLTRTSSRAGREYSGFRFGITGNYGL